MNARYIKWGIITFIAVIVLGVALVFILNRKEEVSISSSKEASAVNVDFEKHSNLLTSEQQIKLQLDLISTTTSKNTTDTSINGVIRASSMKHPTRGETTFIIDVPRLQTSYLISRYVSSEESIDIVNITCVPDKQKVYPKDYCYEE